MAADVAELIPDSTLAQGPRRGSRATLTLAGRARAPHHLLPGTGGACHQAGRPGTNDLVVSDVLRPNELQAWLLSEHLVNAPLVEAEPLRKSA